MDLFFGFAKELLDQGLAREVSSYGDENLFDRVITFTADLDFYQKLAQEQAGEGGQILDIGCGTGRVMLPLLEAGYNLVGLDLNEGMLKVARKKLAEQGFTPPLYQGDMRDYQLEERFRLIIIPYFAMIYISTDEDRLKVLEKAYQHLEPGGVLAFDFDAGRCQLGMSKPWLGLQEINPDTGEVTVQTVQMNGVHEFLRIANIITYRHKGATTKVEVNASSEATCAVEQMQELMETAGFTVRGFYSDYNYTPYEAGEECIVIAEKK